MQKETNILQSINSSISLVPIVIAVDPQGLLKPESEQRVSRDLRGSNIINKEKGLLNGS